MIFRPTAIDGVTLVDTTPHADDRGFFTRLYCPAAFAEAGHPFAPVQTSLSRSLRAGTLRGLHWQAPPFAETKLVRVVRGRIFDVCVDIRPGSPTYLDWIGVEIDESACRAVLIGHGIAHGFMTLVDDTDVLYQIAPAHSPGHGLGARWDDPAFGIAWPGEPVSMSDRDVAFAPFVVDNPADDRGSASPYGSTR